MVVSRTMWTQCTSVTDGQTDRRTDRRTDRITITKTVQTASHGKIGHCIQRPTLFPGRAGGGSELSRARRGAPRLWRLEGAPVAPLPLPIRESEGSAPENLKKINFKIAYVLHFCKLKWSHLHAVNSTALQQRSTATAPLSVMCCRKCLFLANGIFFDVVTRELLVWCLLTLLHCYCA